MNIMELFTPEKYSDTIATIALIVSVVAVPASGYFSYHYAIKGERRKEFNAIADPIRLKLQQHFRHLAQGLYPSGAYIKISQSDYDSLIDVSYPRDRKRLRQLCIEYEDALSESVVFDGGGSYKVISFDAAKKALSEILILIERK